MVGLKVFDGEDNMILSHIAVTKSLGEHIHVLNITATSNTPILTSGLVYKYNLEFDGSPMIMPNGSLTDGILQNSQYTLNHGLAYAGFNYPTFVLPANDKNQLKFVHGSCRKPHGGITDALRGLDTILSTTITGSTGMPMPTPPNVQEEINQRPQFLCLTGDQIYADDVSDSLLFILMDMEEHLFNWGTSNSREDLPESPSTNDLKPGNRQDLVAPRPDHTIPNKISSSYAKSHLIKLAEFYGMYLLVWSDVLWPRNDNDFPRYESVFPGSERTFQIEEPEVFNSGNSMPTGRTITRTNPHYTSFVNETAKILEFKKSLPFIRKALANIPTYMMFDDHEITDDWFITKLWVQNAMNPNTLSRRLIQNGLSAFAVFQAWGNTPERFSNGNGSSILSSLESLNSNGGANQSVWDSIGGLVLPRFNSGNNRLLGGFDWHFHIDFDVFRLIVLDTRTKRGFSAAESFPALISTAVMQQQIPTATDLDFSIVVSPAPVIGNIAIENLQRLVRNPIIAFFKGGPGNNYFMDQEAWIFNKPAFEQLLDILSSFNSTIFLSGDVHYGFSITIDYWNNRTGTVQRSGIAQLCSSSLKNSDSGTNNASSSSFARPRLRTDNFNNYSFLGWNTPGGHIRGTVLTVIEGTQFPTSAIGTNWVRGTPAVHLIDGNFDSIINEPDWRYRLIFETDVRTSTNRLLTRPNVLSSTNQQAQAGYNHFNRFNWDGHRYTVGKDNIGFVKIKSNGNSLHHEFWYVLGADSNALTKVLQPSTIHDVNLAPPPTSETMPGN